MLATSADSIDGYSASAFSCSTSSASSPSTAAGGELLFNLLAERYEKRSVTVTRAPTTRRLRASFSRRGSGGDARRQRWTVRGDVVGNGVRLRDRRVQSDGGHARADPDELTRDGRRLISLRRRRRPAPLRSLPRSVFRRDAGTRSGVRSARLPRFRHFAFVAASGLEADGAAGISLRYCAARRRLFAGMFGKHNRRLPIQDGARRPQ